MARALLFLLALASCRAAPYYEPPAWTQVLHGEMRFLSARLADADTAVYSVAEGRYRPVDDQPLWARGRREYVVAIHALGVLDVATGEHRVLHQELIERTGDGNGRFTVVDARGDFALVMQGRRTEGDVLVDPGGWFLLDLAGGALERIDPVAELKRFESELKGDPRLCDGAGTVLLEARPRNPLIRLDRPSRWIARPRGGDLVDLGVGRLLGETAGGLVLERPDGEGLLFDPRTRTVAALSEEELGALAPRPAAPAGEALEIRDGGTVLAFGDPERTIDVAAAAR